MSWLGFKTCQGSGSSGEALALSGDPREHLGFEDVVLLPLHTLLCLATGLSLGKDGVAEILSGRGCPFNPFILLSQQGSEESASVLFWHEDLFMILQVNFKGA